MTDSATVAKRSPLARRDWSYVEKPTLEDFTAADWRTLNAQREPYYAEHQADHALRLLAVHRDEPTFGYQVNNYRHCLQSATLALKDGRDEEVIVMSLLHDIGFIACPASHAEFAVALLGPYLSERNRWMLERHAVFQLRHCHGYPGVDSNECERWRGHPHFVWAAEWVARYDQNTVDPRIEEAPIEVFVPMVRRFFARPPRRPVAPD
ncbi:MAG: phosphohydrolase [Alphaproteobacteria bacterium]|nr:phosphohydrolase [Alphaproteobacteria bacterium]